MPASLTRWRPFGELEELRTRMDRMFDDLMGDARELRAEAAWTPAIDVERDNGNLVVRADVPGIKPDEIKIEVEDDMLTLSGQHEERKEEKERDFVRRERRYGGFRRSIPLPRDVDVDKIEARTRDGVVEVTVPLPEKPGGARKVITPTAT